jgi:hypothetical protein
MILAFERILLFGTVSVMLGAAIAYVANSYPEQHKVMETMAGILLIGGFGLLGCALEGVFGHP